MIIKSVIFTILFPFLLLLPINLFASNYYIAQSAQGEADGTSCANARAYSWDWSGVNDGDTVWICGTITGSASYNSTGITIPKGGTSTPITLKFCSESDCGAGNTGKLSNAYWNQSYGAIYSISKNNIIIDGNGGIIENTDNGISGYTYDEGTAGVVVDRGNNIEIKNLKVRNLYIKQHYTVHSCSGESRKDSAGLAVFGGSNIKIHDNNVTEVANGILYAHNLGNSATYSDIQIYNNITTRTNWGLALGINGSGDVVNNVKVYNNDVTIGSNFECGTVDIGYHMNGLIIYGDSTGTLDGIDIYNNYFHGEDTPDGDWTCTGFIYQTVVITTGERIYNNLFNGVSGNPSNAYIQIGHSPTAVSTTDPLIANNTIVGYGQAGRGIAHYKDNGNATIRNNIIMNTGLGLHIDGTGYELISDSNLYYNNGRVAYWDGYLTTLASLQTKMGGCPGTDHECNSIASNPDLDTNYFPKSTSPVVGKGANLTSLGITSLNSDQHGVARPSSNAWCIGAYEYAIQKFTGNTCVGCGGYYN